MKIVLLNGSPKVNESASSVLLKSLKSGLLGQAEIVEEGLHKASVPEEVFAKLRDADAVVFAYPLYVDGIPAHLLSCLVQMEKAQWQEKERRIYGIVNCGFYEGIQAEPALEILQNWCEKTGFVWGGGAGIGGGGALLQLPEMENGKGPRGPVDKAVREMADKILSCRTQENQYVSIAFPRLMYKMAAQAGWRQQIKANGKKVKDLGERPE